MGLGWVVCRADDGITPQGVRVMSGYPYFVALHVLFGTVALITF